MSSVKHQLEKEREYRDIAYEILKDLGVIKECPIHDDWYTTTDFAISQEDYARATVALKKAYPEYNDFETFHDAIKGIEDDASMDDECPYCN